MKTLPLWVLAASLIASSPPSASAIVVAGGGPKRTDCLLELSTTTGQPFPAGRSALGATCADGDVCDPDATRNAVCRYSVSLCINTTDPALPGCTARDLKSVKVKATGPKGQRPDLSALEAAIAGLTLPAATPQCTAPVDLEVPVGGPDKKGEPQRGKVELSARANRANGQKHDVDHYELVCLPAAQVPPSPPPTLPPVSPETPDVGLKAAISAASVAADGTVQVTFTLTDDAGAPVTPVLSSTTDPDEARVRFTIARLDEVQETLEGLTRQFTRYRNYITSPQTSPITGQTANLPTFDSRGALAAVDPVAGIWSYTFGKKLAEGFDGNLTHTIGAQVERTVDETRFIANPLFDFVPAGGAVTTMREVVVTQQCNTCHNRLEAHGGGRREVKLCQLCHTDQAVDPDTGNSIELLNMIHRIHDGRDLPSVTNGPVGSEFTIIGFNQSRNTYAEKVTACSAGAFAGIPCTSDADCGSGGTCTSTITTGVGFPRDIRDCEACHTGGAQSAQYLNDPSTAACSSCHDDVNPGKTPTAAGAPGTGHLAGAQTEAACHLCHTPSGEEFGDSVAGAHVNPLRSTQLSGLQAELLSATGAPGGLITVTFRLSNGAGIPLTTLTGIGRLAFAASGPTSDFGGSSKPLLRVTAFPIPATEIGVLTGPDGNNVFTYTFPIEQALPADAAGTWRIGIEGRRSVTLVDPDPDDPQPTVNEALQNKVLDFSVDGSPVEPRREVVDLEKCSTCHGTFSVDFSVHGGLRNQVDYCVVCHNPRVTDFAVRAPVVPVGASPDTETVHLKVLLHKLHTGEELHERLYIVYGNRSRPVDLGEVRFPGDRRDCQTCHLEGTNLLPLPEDLLPTRLTTIVAGVETPLEERPPTQAACLACHDTEDARAHARINTFEGVEVCHVCHGEGRVVPVSEVHRREP
jgi:hypothetical protein